MERIKKWLNTNPVISSLLASILFFVFLQPLLQNAMIEIPRLLGDMGVTLVNEIYNQAAQASLYSLFCSVLVIVFTYCILWGITSFIELKRGIRGNLRELDEISTEITNMSKEDTTTLTNDNSKEVSADNHQKDFATNLDTTSKRIENARRKNRRYMFLSNVMIVIIIIFAIFFTLVFIAPNYLKFSFDKELLSIKPYITEKEIITLESKWVQMDNFTDYEEIYKVIRDVKEENALS